MHRSITLGLLAGACGGALGAPGVEAGGGAAGSANDASAADAGDVGTPADGGVAQVDCKEQAEILHGCVHPQCATMQPIGCAPRPCTGIPTEFCPTSRCLLWPDCNGELQCTPPPIGGAPACNAHGLFEPGANCCPGTVPRCTAMQSDGTCGPSHDYDYNLKHFPICLACGNHQCDKFEDHCNCPEDCPAAIDGGTDAS